MREGRQPEASERVQSRERNSELNMASRLDWAPKGEEERGEDKKEE